LEILTMRTTHRNLLFTVLLATLLTGCANPWQSNYRANPMYRDVRFSTTEDVQIRTVEYERFQQYAERERQIRIESTVAPQDLPREEQLAARQRLLDALQIPEPADRTIVLGWSEFTETQRLDPHERPLSDFARRRGADYAVVTSAYRGPVTTVVREPVTTYSHGWVTGTPVRRGRVRSTTFTDTSTTWVPMQITEDAYFYQAFFLRRARPDDAVVP
jgi:nucleotide-binding universal stress UspA family protein